MKECDNSKIHISSNFILSMCLLIMFDALLLRPSLHFTQLHFTTLHPTTLHYTSLQFTTLHPSTLRYTSPHFTQLHFATPHHTSPKYTSLHFATFHHTSPNYTWIQSVEASPVSREFSFVTLDSMFIRDRRLLLHRMANCEYLILCPCVL